MNWYKKILTSDLVKEPSNLKEAIEKTYSIIYNFAKNNKLNRGETKHIDRIMLNNPYLNIEVPVDIYVFYKKNGSHGRARNNLYEVIYDHKQRGEEFQGIDQPFADEPTSSNIFEILFTENDNQEQGEFESVESYIEINLFNAIKDKENLKNTLQHEFIHIIDPNVFDIYKKESPSDNFEKYIFNITEYNANMNELRQSVISDLQGMTKEEQIETLKYFIDSVRVGDIEYIIDELTNGYIQDKFSDYYLVDPKMRQQVIKQFSKLISDLLRETEEQKDNYELV